MRSVACFFMLLALQACGGGTSMSSTAPASATSQTVKQQLVFMYSTGANTIAPGPGTVYEIALMNIDGSNFRQLTSDGTFKFLPHFSPDGTKLVYTKYETGAYGVPYAITDIAVYDFASSTETMLTHDGHAVQGTWSPDGTRIAYLETTTPTAIWTMTAKGANAAQLAAASGSSTDMMWGDLAWSPTNWLLFTVGQTVNGCFKVRTDKILPDGTQRTQVSDGGPNCTPAGFEQSGDADPGWSPDGNTIYSSRGFPVSPTGGSPGSTERKLYAFSSSPWTSGKVETDLSLPAEPNCIEGVPKAAPDGTYVALFRACFDSTNSKPGIYITDASGSYRSFAGPGFGPDWNPKT